MEETKKLPVAERVAKKTMGMTKWFTEQYFQTYEMVSKDPRYKTLPPYNQTSCCLLYTSPSPRDMRRSRMPSSA